MKEESLNQVKLSAILIMEILITLSLVALLIFLVFNYFRRNPVFEMSNTVLQHLSEKTKK